MKFEKTYSRRGCRGMTKRVLNTEAGKCANDGTGTNAFGSRKAAGGSRISIVLLLLLVATAICGAQEGRPPSAQIQPLEPCGLFSDLRTPPLLVPRFEPTAIRIMSSRYLDLWQVNDGYNLTGVDLVAYNGVTFVPAGYSDDLGIYYYIPWISRAFHLSLAHSISIFLVSALVLSVASGSLGLLLVLRSWPSRIVGLMVLGVLTFLAYHYGDVYLFEFAVPVALVPWIVRQARRQTHSWHTGALLAIAGLVIGLAATVRTAAAIPTLLIVVVLIATQFQVRRSRKIALTALSLAFALWPVLFLHHLANKRNHFLLGQTSIQPQDLNRHTFWHFAYIGLGFISNPYVPGGVCDDIGKLRVRAIAPEAVYLSDQYDAVLRNEVIATVTAHPPLVFFTLAAKLGILIVIIAAFGGLAIVAAIYRPIDKRILATFVPALGVSALPILLVAPSPHYLMSIFTLAALYGTFSFDSIFLPDVGSAPEAIAQPHNQRQDLAELGQEQFEYVTPRSR